MSESKHGERNRERLRLKRANRILRQRLVKLAALAKDGGLAQADVARLAFEGIEDADAVLKEP